MASRTLLPSSETVGDQLLAKQRRDILLQAQLVCIDVIRLNQSLAMLRERLANSETLLQMYEKRMEAGDANALELNKVKIDCMEVRTLVGEVEGERTALPVTSASDATARARYCSKSTIGS